MKKIFIAVLALAAVAACNKAEVVEQNPGNAIGFDNVFVNNATKSVDDPSFDADNMFDDFAVYGFVEGAELFNGTTVSKEISNDDLKDTEWKYTGTQYWIAGAKYNFSAVAPVTDKKWEKTAADTDGVTLTFTNDGTQDLLYAKTDEIEGEVSGNDVVSFQFRHVLSKVKLSFENEYNASNATIQVRDIKIVNAYATGNVALDANTTWTAQAGKLLLEFGNAAVTGADALEPFGFNEAVESYKELLIIPGGVEGGYVIEFVVDLLVNGTKVTDYEHTAKVDFTPVAGNCYDIKATINASNIDPAHAQEPIQFTVAALPGWTDKDQTATIQ